MSSTIKFTLRKDQPNKDGSFQIRLIYQIKGERKYFAPDKNIFAINWQDKEQIAVYVDRKEAKKLLPTFNYNLLASSKEVSAINDKLSSLKKEIAIIEAQFELNSITYSTKDVIDKLKETITPTTKEEAPNNQVFDFIDNYIEDNKTTREPGSLSVYKSLKTHLQAYQLKTKKKVTFDNIDCPFFLGFQTFLIGTKSRGAANGLGNVTIAKILSTLKTFLNYARTKEIEVSDKYKDFKIKKEPLEVIALTESEFRTLYNLDLSGSRKLAQVRDVFCMAITTGLRYSDIKQLKREHIKNNEIRLTVTKTKTPLLIPLNPYSLAILDKYADMEKPLPVISNAKTNEYLKELCEKAEINDPIQIVRFRGPKREEKTYPKYELISFHTGRKSFCTLSLERGMSAEQVMKISGHKTYASFSRYVNVTEKLTRIVMGKAWGEIPLENKLIAV
jgi:integrase